MMTNDKVLEGLLIEEDELIDDYLWGNLSPDEREGFHQTFLCTKERQDKLRFARAFQDYVQRNSAESEPVSGWWQRFSVGLLSPSPAAGYAFAALLIVAISGSLWMNLRFQRRLDEVSGENARLSQSEQELQEELSTERSRRDEMAADLSQERSERERLQREVDALAKGSSVSTAGSVPTVASFLLAPGLLRGGGDTERVLIPSGASLVELQLDVGLDDYGSYRVALRDVNGDEILTQSQLRGETVSEKAVVTVTLPANLLPHGDYSLRVSGITTGGDVELVARYYFRAIPQ
jgi:hypothetical protein